MCPTMLAVLCALVASIGFFLVGYDESIMMSYHFYLINHLHMITFNQYSVVRCFTTFCCILGALIAGVVADIKGQKFTIIISGFLYILGVISMYFSSSYFTFMFSRIPIGVAMGINLTITPVYIVELSSSFVRGSLTTIPEVLYNIGFLVPVTYFVEIDNAKLSKLIWGKMLGVSIILSLAMIVCTLAMPESPCWLIRQGRLADSAQILYRYTKNIDEANQRLQLMRLSSHIPLEETGDVVIVPPYISKVEVLWWQFFDPTPIGYTFISVIGLHAIQKASTMNIMLLKVRGVLDTVGKTNYNFQHYCVIFILGCKIITILVCILLIDKYGRRKLLLFSIGMMAIFSALYGVSILTLHDGKELLGTLSLICLFIFIMSFSAGLGPIAWVYGAEAFPCRYRVQGASLGVCMNQIIYISQLLLFSMLPTPDWVIVSSYTAILIVGFVFSYVYVREMRCQILETI